MGILGLKDERTVVNIVISSRVATSTDFGSMEESGEDEKVWLVALGTCTKRMHFKVSSSRKR